jgi:hypothetical protein
MMLPSLLVALALAQTPPPGIPPVRSDPKTGPVIAFHQVFMTSSVVALWLEGGEQGPSLVSVEPLFGEFQTRRYPEPVGDGTWVELLNGKMQLMAAYRGAVPPPGERCAVEVPIVKGTWWVLIVERRSETTKILGQYEVGPDLARIASRLGADQ